jgi:hypothetical protein
MHIHVYTINHALASMPSAAVVWRPIGVRLTTRRHVRQPLIQRSLLPDTTMHASCCYRERAMSELSRSCMQRCRVQTAID